MINLSTLMLAAQDAAAAAAPVAAGAAPAAGSAPAGGGFGSTVFLLVGMVAVMYFLLIRPKQKEQREHREMIAKLRKGDRVTTYGGLIGKIVRANDDEEVTVEIADGVRVKVVRSMIMRVTEGEQRPANDDEDDETDD